MRTWLFGILHNKALEERRKRGQEEGHEAIDDVFETRFDSHGNWSAPPLDLGGVIESTGELCKILGVTTS